MAEKTFKSNEIWEKIKDTKLHLFSLPPVALSEHVIPKLNFPGDVLYIQPKKSNGIVIPVLEDLIKDEYVVSRLENGWLEIKEINKPKL
jgi:hypothetical protein